MDATTVTEPATYTYSIQNVCACTYCEACEGWQVQGDVVCDCGATTEAYDCEGICYEDALADLHEALGRWLAANPGAESVEIDGSGMGWQHRTGWTVVEATPEAVAEAIGVASEWVQRWEFPAWDGNEGVLVGATVRAVQSHHDSMGEVYEFRTSTDPVEVAQERRYAAM